MLEALSFEDVLLVPRYSDIESRLQVDISNKLSNDIVLNLPVISSPMDTITESEMAVAIYKAGGLGIIHRYNSIENQIKLVRNAITLGADSVSAAIGVTGDFESRAMALYDAGVRVLCIDIAHGHHSFMKNALSLLRNTFGKDIHLMAGNVATQEGFEMLADYGADSVRVGIGGGSICSTRLVSGHGVPTLQSILECAKSGYDTKIIADGGIRSSGDIVKAYAAGADFVIVGSVLAGTKETPGEIFSKAGGEKYKVYRGMASSSAQETWRGKSSTPEGVSTTILYKGKVKNVLEALRGGIRSGFSYSGCRSFSEFQAKAKFIKQTNAGQTESGAHILRGKI